MVQVGGRLAIFYDGNAAGQMPTGVKSHMNRDVGLAWLDLPLVAFGGSVSFLRRRARWTASTGTRGHWIRRLDPD